MTNARRPEWSRSRAYVSGRGARATAYAPEGAGELWACSGEDAETGEDGYAGWYERPRRYAPGRRPRCCAA
ncbi:hypothetical protein MTP02_54940 [Streptomyces albus]|nr:hypothetical protein MTP02_54940 [Streptomyces albus]